MKTQDAAENPLVGRGGGNTNKLQSSISKRRKVMKATRFLRSVLWALVVGSVLVGLSFGQTFKNNGALVNNLTFKAANFQNYNTKAGVVHNSGSMWMTANLTNSGGGFNGEIANQIAATPGTLKVDGNFTNGTGFTWNSLATSLIQVGGALSNTTAANFATDTGRVEYYNAGTPQTILVNIKSTTYGGLTASGGGGAGAKKTLGGNVTVVGTVNVANVSVLEVGAGNALIVQAYPSAFNLNASGTLDASAATATVNYAAPGTNAQNVIGATYGNLTVSNGTGTRTALGAVTVKTVLTNLSATTLDFSTFALDASTATSIVNTGATIRSQGSVTLNATPPTIAGLFIYEASSGTQSVGTATYNDLTVQAGAGAAGQKNFPTGTVAVTGAYTATGATRNYGLTTSTFEYAGITASSTQTVVGGESYNNLTIAGAVADTGFVAGGHKKANASLSVAGALTIAANNVLDMQSNSITTLGSGANSGKIMWAASNKAVAGAGITEFYAEFAGTVDPSASYGVLLFTGGGTKTIGGVVTAGPGSTLGTGVAIAAVTGNLTVSGTGNLTVNGDLQNDGVLTNSGQVTVQ
jgi:hypothetical protein